VTIDIALPSRSVALRPLALPAEHGGWGFLAEPILLGLLIAPSWSGALVAASAVFGFLARHPLKLAFQDAVRGRRYPRTFWCRALAASYLIAALLSLSGAVVQSGAGMLVPFALATPFAVLQAWRDAKNHGRELLAEASYARPLAAAAMAVLSIRAAWGLTHEAPRAKVIGWREIAFGLMTVGLSAMVYQ